MNTEVEKKLRANSTAPERKLWRLIYPLRTGDYHFRKQEQIGPYYVDFVCHHANLIVELDGETHYVAGAQDRDEQRDAFLRGEGYSVLRFTNLDVMSNPDGVYRVISEQLAGRPKRRTRGLPPPGLPHQGGGEEAALPPLDSTNRALQ
ncbi:MAG: endonuclease domain-containing protein [Devosia sp.]|nr:endonuclease domain-containing protein [Devosia sp.]